MQSLITFVTVLAAVSSRGVAVNVGTCEQFAAVDGNTETEVTITTADFACDEYTRLSIHTDMVLKSSVGKVTFSNLALKIYGSLTVEPDVVFTGITLVKRHGGALNLSLGAVGVFKGTTDFIGNSITSTYKGTKTRLSTGSVRIIEIQRKGGAIHNKGDLIFEKDASFVGNRNEGVRLGSGLGGAISVHVKGTIHFMGKLTMKDNFAGTDDSGSEGGAIANRGDIIVDGEATFTGNKGAIGGAIYQERWATFVFNDFVSFTSNECYDFIGGSVVNFGGDFTCEAGSLFFKGVADRSGNGGLGGGIYNSDGGVVTLKGSTTFRENYGKYGGAIFNQAIGNLYSGVDVPYYKIPVITYPDDTAFEDNYGKYCNDVAYTLDRETCGL